MFSQLGNVDFLWYHYTVDFIPFYLISSFDFLIYKRRIFKDLFENLQNVGFCYHYITNFIPHNMSNLDFRIYNGRIFEDLFSKPKMWVFFVTIILWNLYLLILYHNLFFESTIAKFLGIINYAFVF